MTLSAVDTHVPGQSGRRTKWAVPLLLCAAVLLIAGLVYNLAHLDTGGEQLPTPPGSGSPPPNFWGLLGPGVLTQIVAGFFLVLLVGGVLYAVLRRNRVEARPIVRPSAWREFLPIIVAVLVVALLLYLWPRVARSGAPQTSGNETAANNTLNETTIPQAGGIPLGIFLGIALVIAIVAVGLLLQTSGRLRRMEPGTRFASRRQAAITAVEAAISELQLGADVRGVIMACYQRFCLLLGARGIADQEALTPRELEGLAVERLAVSPESVGSLTSLFEEARYSTHNLGERDRDRAVDSLGRIRTALEA